MTLVAVPDVDLTRDLGGARCVLLDDPPDLRRDRRAEQRQLLVLRRAGQDRLDVLGEAHVEHLVGLVEYDEAQPAQVEGALLEVVHHPARRTDHDVHAAAQGDELHAVPLPAVHREHVQPLEVGGVATERLGDLQRELAGRREHQHLRRRLRQVDAREDRQRERRGLAGAGLGETDDVLPCEQRRDRLGLDRRGGLVADVPEDLLDPGVQSQLVETGAHRTALTHRPSVVPQGRSTYSARTRTGRLAHARISTHTSGNRPTVAGCPPCRRRGALAAHHRQRARSASPW